MPVGRNFLSAYLSLHYTPNTSKTMDSSNSGIFNYIKENQNIALIRNVTVFSSFLHSPIIKRFWPQVLCYGILMLEYYAVAGIYKMEYILEPCSLSMKYLGFYNMEYLPSY